MSWVFSASGSQTYKQTFTCRDKGEHKNTATIRESGQNDSTTVVVKCKDKDYGDDDCKKGKKDKDRWGWSHEDRRGDRCDDDDHGDHHGDDDHDDDDDDRGDCDRGRSYFWRH
jgi:hypothetical protein